MAAPADPPAVDGGGGRSACHRRPPRRPARRAGDHRRPVVRPMPGAGRRVPPGDDDPTPPRSGPGDLGRRSRPRPGRPRARRGLQRGGHSPAGRDAGSAHRHGILPAGASAGHRQRLGRADGAAAAGNGEPDTRPATRPDGRPTPGPTSGPTAVPQPNPAQRTDLVLTGLSTTAAVALLVFVIAGYRSRRAGSPAAGINAVPVPGVTRPARVQDLPGVAVSARVVARTEPRARCTDVDRRPS